MNANQSGPVRIFIVKEQAGCRVVPGTAIVGQGTQLRFVVIPEINVKIVFPPGVTKEGQCEGNGSGDCEVTVIGEPGSYPYSVFCREEGQPPHLAQGNSEPKIIIPPPGEY
jgi:hypothetical protein